MHIPIVYSSMSACVFAYFVFRFCLFQDERLAWRVPRALRDEVVKHEAAKAICLDGKADEVTLQIMRGFSESAIVQGQCLRLLGALAFGNDLVSRTHSFVGSLVALFFDFTPHEIFYNCCDPNNDMCCASFVSQLFFDSPPFFQSFDSLRV